MRKMTKIVRSVTGMTCQHCVRAVSAAVRDVPGVRTVEVDLGSGTVVVEGDGDIVETAVDEAVTGAGYGIR